MAEAGVDEEVVAAGFLHDVLEDVLGPAGIECLKKEFGERVTQAVVDVSEKKDPTSPVKSTLSWVDRKQEYLDHLSSASDDALLVALADKIHNLESILWMYKKEGAGVLEKFSAPKGKFIWYYAEVLTQAQKRLPNHSLTENLVRVVGECRENFSDR